MSEPSPCTPRLDGKYVGLPDPAEAAAAFQTARALVCPGFFGGDLLASLMRAADRSVFMSDDVHGLGHRETERPAVMGTAIQLALRQPALHRWLEAVTGLGPIGRVDGRVAQTRARAGDQLAWHDDMNGEDRRLGITINLGDAAYEGGLFEMRDRATGAELVCFKHKEVGTALIFEVSTRCEHRVHPLVAGGPRRVFAGWFLT